MKKNYKRYWKILSEKRVLRLVFQHSKFQDMYPNWKMRLNHEVTLWKAGLSREKYKDYTFQTKNPYHRIEYQLEINDEKGTTTLVATVLDANQLLATNPKIEFTSPEVEGEA